MSIEYHNDIVQGSDAWFEIRAGKPTASEFSKIITGTGKRSDQITKYAARLAAEKYTGTPIESFEGNRHTERGNELEDEARASYSLKTMYDIEETGFVTNGDYGCSPDGLVAYDGLVEIKCLSSEQHVLMLHRYRTKGDIEPKYIPQLQGQLLVTQREWVDIHFYHPQLPWVTHRFEPDLGYQIDMNAYLGDCVALRDQFLESLK